MNSNEKEMRGAFGGDEGVGESGVGKALLEARTRADLAREAHKELLRQKRQLTEQKEDGEMEPSGSGLKTNSDDNDASSETTRTDRNHASQGKKRSVSQQKRRLIANRESAEAARVRREVYTKELESALDQMETENFRLSELRSMLEKRRSELIRDIEGMKARQLEESPQRSPQLLPEYDTCHFNPAA
eukprot:CAMPEP_0185846582 /NCGR_PEP_ID=MMETSP1354-20130828/2165_1 /TAXON_ID=708628 /ORGANISM="Erythrolobus madagascarensis, Strain CCMP3276" /LENGTH=187 /DNA_ID=CAMNT_0028546731 /DNA_START=93 /DNA_END=656 /DNA_ORIENTATION=-